MKVWSFIPLLRFEQGHLYSYNLAVGQACAMLGWDYQAFVPVSCKIDLLPSSFEKVLAEEFFVGTQEISLFQKCVRKWFSFCRSILPLCKSLRRIGKKPHQIIFLEQFGVEHLVSFTLAVLLTSIKAEIVLVHRYSPQQLKLKAYVYRLLHRLLAWKVGKKHVKLCADSELLAKVQKPFFRKDVCVLPIPHTEIAKPFVKTLGENLLVWWPGGLTTVSKGLTIIEKIAQSRNDHITLVVADSAKIHLVSSKMPIQYISAHLSRSDYIAWMHRVDLIILPYDAAIYHAATSGIFVEATAMGKMCFVTHGTWMAYELARFDLHELIIEDWLDTQLFAYFRKCLTSQDILQKLERMKHFYRHYHSVKGFAEVLQRL